MSPFPKAAIGRRISQIAQISQVLTVKDMKIAQTDAQLVSPVPIIPTRAAADRPCIAGNRFGPKPRKMRTGSAHEIHEPGSARRNFAIRARPVGGNAGAMLNVHERMAGRQREIGLAWIDQACQFFYSRKTPTGTVPKL